MCTQAHLDVSFFLSDGAQPITRQKRTASPQDTGGLHGFIQPSKLLPVSRT